MTGEPDPRTVEQRRGRALVESLRRAAQVTSGAGSLAGAKATLVVAMDLDDLKARIGAGTVLTSTVADTLLAPETVRRLACDAQIIPAVLGGPSSVLDWGETQRLFQPAQVKALWLRDRGCTFRAVRLLPPGAMRTMSGTGSTAARPTCRTQPSSAADTTRSCTVTS